MIVYDYYYIFISLLCCNFVYVIFVLCLRKKQPKKQANAEWEVNTQFFIFYLERFTLAGCQC